MFNFALIVVVAGLVILTGIGVWARLRRGLDRTLRVEEALQDRASTSVAAQESGAAVIVASEFGQLVYLNDQARRWLGVRGALPTLEYLATRAQPSDTLRNLIAQEGNATFQLGDRWVEAVSHRIPSENEVQMVMTLREMTAENGHSSNGHYTGGLDVSLSMRLIGEIEQTVSASLSVDQVVQTILTIIRKSLPVDAGEICLWNERTQALEQRGWLGDASYLIELMNAGGGYQQGEGITGWVAKYKEPLLVSDVSSPDAIRPKLPNNPYKSFVAVPLMRGDQFIGTLEIVHREVGYFRPHHLALMQTLIGPVAGAIFNADLYSRQSRRINDIATLQQVGQNQKIQANAAEVYRTLSQRIASLMDSDVSGVVLYDPQRRQLIGQPPFHGLPDVLAARIAIPVGGDAAANPIWEQQVSWISNDLHDDPMIEGMNLTGVATAAGLRNVMMAVMQIGSQRIGMMLLANKQNAMGFTSQDEQNLRILVTQAAIVVENIRLFQREQRHDTELVGLQEITRAIGALTSEEEVDLYSDINARIAGLMAIQMCGILLYDEMRQQLVAQLPFYGVPDQLLQGYAIDLASSEVVAELWQEQDYWYTNRAKVDTLVFAAGLETMAEGVGVEKTLIASLSAGGRKLGVIQVSNKISGADFNDNDARLLMIFATQAAAIIENARLVRVVRRRANEADRLRLIAERSGNLVTLEESLAPILSEVAQLVESGVVFLGLFDAGNSSLTVAPRAIFGVELDAPLRFSRHHADFYDLVANTAKPLIVQDTANLKTNMIYQETINRLKLRQMVVVPLSIGDRTLGELGIGNRTSGPYTDTDLALLSNVAAQFSTTVDRVRLFEQVGSDLDRREKELDAISNISRVLTETFEINTILERLRQQVIAATDAQGCTVAMLRTVEGWDRQSSEQLSYRVGETILFSGLADIERDAAVRNDAVLVMDYAGEPLKPQPANAASAVAIPFEYANVIVGVLHLHDQRVGLFDVRGVAFLKTMAAKASLGFGNAARYYEQLERSRALRQRVEQLNQIFELGQMLQTNVEQSMMLEAIAYSIVQSVGFDVVVIAMADAQSNTLRRVTQAGLPVDEFERSKQFVISLDELQKLFMPEFLISNESYFFPLEKLMFLPVKGLEALGTSFLGNRSMYAAGPDFWHDGDMLLVPIAGAGGAGQLLGLISLDRPQDNRRPDRSKLEILEIFAHQASTTIENNRLYLASVRNAELESRLNEMLEQVARTLNIAEIVEAVGYSALRLAPFSQVSVALRAPDGLLVDVYSVQLASDGTVMVQEQKQVDVTQTAIGYSLNSRTEAFYVASDEIPAFSDLAEWQSGGERFSMVLPLFALGQTLGTIHFGSNERTFDYNDYRALISRVVQVTAVAVQNARLFDQAVNLQLFNESVLESIQQGIVVVDVNGAVFSANGYIADEYGWDVEGRQPIRAYSPHLADILDEPIRTVLQSAEPIRILEERSKRENIPDIVQNFYIYPLLGSSTAVSGAVVLLEDVTERAQLQATIEARANQLTALTRASSQITGTLQRDQVIALALDAMQDVVAYDKMTLWRRTAYETMQLVGARGVPMLMSPPLEVELQQIDRMRQVIETQGVVRIDDLPRYLSRRQYSLPGDNEAQSWLGVPLINQNVVVGMMTIAKSDAKFYTAQSEQAALAFANQVASAITNADLYTETASRTERLSILNRVSLALVQSVDTETIFEVALTEIVNALKAESSRAVQFDSNMEVGRVVVDVPRGENTPTQQFRLLQQLTYRYVMENSQALVYSHERRMMPVDLPDDVNDAVLSLGVLDYILIPMLSATRLIGAFEIESRNRPLDISPETLEIATIIANQAAIAIQNVNQLEESTIRNRELETLLDAAQSTTLTLDLEQVFKRVADLFLTSLDMDDCAIMLWDDLENVLEVQIDINREGNPDRISPRGTRIDLKQYPQRMHALRHREVIVVSRVLNDAQDNIELRELALQGDSSRIFVPLVVRDQSIGLIQGEVKNPTRLITDGEQRLGRALGTQVAVAIENARLTTETAAQMDELFVINDLSQAISSTIDIDRILKVVRDQLPVVTGAQELYIALYNQDKQQITFPVAMQQGQVVDLEPRNLGADEVSFIIRNRRPLLLGSDYFSTDDVRRSLGITNGEGDIKSYLGVPLMSGQDVLGVLAVRDTERTRVFGLNEQRIMTTIGTQLGATLQNARLFERVQRLADDLNLRVQERTEELEQERDRLDMLYQITSELALTLDMDRVLNRSLQMLASAVKADDGVIMLVDPVTDHLYNRASLDLNTIILTDDRATHPAEQLATWLIQNEHELHVDDLQVEPFWNAAIPGAAEWHSAMAVLLETNEDVQGVLVLMSRQVGAFPKQLLNLVIAAANQVASAINNADLYLLIREQAERLGTLLRTEQEEAEKSNAILQSIADGVMFLDAEGKIRLMNGACETVLGLYRNGVMGRSLVSLIEEFNTQISPWANPIVDWLDQVQTGRVFPADRVNVGNRVISVNMSPVTVGAQFLGAVGIFRDVTRDVEVENLKNKFLLSVSHELRTPLTPIKGYAEMMLILGDGLDDSQRSSIEAIKNNADRLTALVNDLLTISQIDAGESPLNVEPIDLARVIEIQLTNARNRHFDKEMTVTVDVEDNLPRAVLDRDKMMQVVGNIVDNAFNYTVAGGKISITLKRDPNDKQNILFAVEDTGLGIPADFREKVWDRFAKYEEHALIMNTSGTGLGLSITRELVQMHGGMIWFDSTEGVGTTFYVSLPIEHRRGISTAIARAISLN